MYRSGGDVCLSIWASCYPRLIDFPPHATVLEIGCAEADWQTPMLAVRPDLQITGIDWRKVKRPGHVIVGDVLTHDFAPESFDAIVSISAIEHIGLGAYGDPTRRNGDTDTMARCVTWLKPGGLMYLDVPYRPAGEHEDHAKWRAYNEQSLASRLVVPGFRVRCSHLETGTHTDAPYLAVILEKA